MAARLAAEVAMGSLQDAWRVVLASAQSPARLTRA